MRKGYFDVDGDGVPELVEPDGFSGTAGGQYYEDLKLSSATPRAGNVPGAASGLEYQILDKERFDFERAWIQFAGRWYLVSFTDEGAAFADAVTYYEAGGRRRVACAFDNATDETWRFGADPDCPPPEERPAAIPADARLSDEEFSQVVNSLDSWMRDRLICPGNRDGCKDLWRLDFDNDGTPDELVKLGVYSGAGRGCSLEFFVLLKPNRDVDFTERQFALRRAQGFVTGHYPVTCGTAVDWRLLGGRYVLERKTMNSRYVGGIQYTTDLVHELWSVQDKQASQLCQSSFRVRPSIRYQNIPAN